MHETVKNSLPLLTPSLRERLLANGRLSGFDHLPVVKFFNPVGIGTWIATELDEDGDRLFGLAQLNDAPELGSFGLKELATLKLPFGLHIERDIFFTGIYPISVYAETARETGSITTAIHVLANSARAGREEGVRGNGTVPIATRRRTGS